MYLDETTVVPKNATVLVKRVAAPRGSVGLLARLKANTPLTPHNMYVRVADGGCRCLMCLVVSHGRTKKGEAAGCGWRPAAAAAAGQKGSAGAAQEGDKWLAVHAHRKFVCSFAVEIRMGRRGGRLSVRVYVFVYVYTTDRPTPACKLKTYTGAADRVRNSQLQQQKLG